MASGFTTVPGKVEGSGTMYDKAKKDLALSEKELADTRAKSKKSGVRFVSGFNKGGMVKGGNYAKRSR